MKFSARVDTNLKPLQALKTAVKNRIIRRAMTQAAKPIRDAVKKNAQEMKRSGGFTKSIGTKVKTYRSNGITVAVVGPRSKWVRVVDGKPYRPSAIAHLLERGSKFIRARHPLENALSSTQEQFKRLLSNAIEEGIQRELSKAN